MTFCLCTEEKGGTISLDMEVAEIPPRCGVGTVRVIELAVIDHRPEIDIASSHQDGSAESGSVVGHKAVDVAHGAV